MDPRDVNRINYNNYYVGQNLDFLIRSKMRSESLSTPLTNTPVFYDDQVSSKMALLGKRGFYDPGYIYGFDNPKSNKNNDDNYRNNKSPQKYSQYNINEREREREQYLNNQNQRDNLSQEQYELEMRRLQELQKNKLKYEQNMNNNNRNDNDYDNYDNKDEYKRRYYQNEMRPQNYPEPPNNNYKNEAEFQREYKDYINRDNQEQNRENNSESNNDLNLPKTREQIQHDVYIENFKRQQLAKQMMMEEEMKYKQQYLTKK